MEFQLMSSPMKIGECEIKNRIVMPPMFMGFGQLDGTPTEKLLDYYEERAKGGTGLIMTEIVRINDFHGATSLTQLAASHDYHIEGLRVLANRIHKHGSKVFVQLHHPGRQNMELMVGVVPAAVTMQKVWKNVDKKIFSMAAHGPKLEEKGLTLSAVSASKCEKSKFAEAKVRGLSRREVKKVIKQFIDGAVRCQKAGIDGVELHGTHGYLIQQFLSPNTNFRTDEYGGSFENRLRFLREIVDGIREKCGNYPIVVRLTVDEYYDKIGQPGKGYGMEEGLKMAKAVEAMGVDALDISSASYDAYNYWLEPTSFEPGWRKHLAAEVKKIVDIPVLAANLIRSPEQAEQQLQDGIQDFVSLGRPHFADPHWANKAFSGNQDQIKRCICCLYCIESMSEGAFKGEHAKCAVNPTVGHERYMNDLRQDGNGRKIVVVGAGVAGLTTAEIFAKRGFDVTVLEKNGHVGGQVDLASKPPKKDKLGWCAKDLWVNATKNGAEVKLNTEATPEVIEAYNPYAVIIATGAVAIRPKSIKGVDHDHVFTTTEILNGDVEMHNKKVAIVGSGMTGLETAELMVEQNNKVTIIEMSDSIAPGTWFQHLDDIMPKLDSKGTQYVTSNKLTEIDESGLVVEDLASGKTSHMDFDAVILSLGARSEKSLADKLPNLKGKVHVIGDAGKVGRIADATGEAYTLATTLR